MKFRCVVRETVTREKAVYVDAEDSDRAEILAREYALDYDPNEWNIISSGGITIESINLSLTEDGLCMLALAHNHTSLSLAAKFAIDTDRLHNGGLREVIRLLLESDDPDWIYQEIRGS